MVDNTPCLYGGFQQSIYQTPVMRIWIRLESGDIWPAASGSGFLFPPDLTSYATMALRGTINQCVQQRKKAAMERTCQKRKEKGKIDIRKLQKVSRLLRVRSDSDPREILSDPHHWYLPLFDSIILISAHTLSSCQCQYPSLPTFGHSMVPMLDGNSEHTAHV